MTARRAAWAALILLAFITSPAPSQPPVAERPPLALHSIRKVYVAQDDLASEIRGLLPLRRREYERLNAALPAAVGADAVPPAALVENATYRATLRGDQFSAGTAEFEIKRKTSPAVDTTPAWVQLSPSTLALGTPTWKAAGNQVTPEEATWGQNETGALLLAVPRGGTLQFPWSQRGRRDERGRVKFEFDLSPAARQRLELRLPRHLQLTSDNTSVRELGSPSAANEQLWQVDAASGRRVNLVVQPRQREAQSVPLVLVRETGNYVFLPGQMDLELSLELDIDRAPLRQIRVRHDPRLQWTAIRWGEQSLAWTVGKSASGEPVAVVNLPEPLTGTSRLIQLTAVADWSPPAAGSPQNPAPKWSLPRATVEDATWQEGRINIAAPRWLQLDAVAGPGARLTATTLATDSQAPDLLQFQLERNTAVIEMQPAVATLPLDAVTMTTLQVEPKQIIANFAAEVSLASGNLFTLECEIPRQWGLDSLETVPADALEDRSVRARGNNQQVVTLQLRQPLRPSRPLRINARLRHVRGGGAEAWNDDILQPVRFTSIPAPQRFVTLQLADASVEPRPLSADGLEFIAPSVLPAKARALSDAPLGNWLVRLTDTARQPRFLLAPGSPRYSATTLLDVQLAMERADYLLRLDCEPESSAVSNVLLQFRPAPASDPQFRLAGEDRPLVAERVEGMTATSDEAVPALYRIELPRPHDGAFQLVAQWSETITARTTVPLPEVPEATALAAYVEISGPLDAPLTWQAERLRPLPIPAAAQQLRARYRYQAGQEARLRLEPFNETKRPVAGWITRCDVETEFAPTGAASHKARYIVAGDEVESLELKLVERARLARAVVEGRDVLPFLRATDSQWISIPLRTSPQHPAGHSPLVRIEYTSPPAGEASWFQSRWNAPLPQTQLPVLQSYWQANLPANWQPWPGEAEEEPVSRWTALGGTLASLWTQSPPPPIHRDLPVGAVAQIRVYSPVWLGIIALLLGLVAAAIVLRTNWNPFHFLAAGLVLLALALLVASPWRSLAEAAFAGWLAGCALQVFRRPLKGRPQLGASVSTAFALHPAVARMWLLLLGIGWVANFASSTVPGGKSQAAEGNKPWRVVIPVDDDQQPTEFVYLSEPLYELLHKRHAAGNTDRPDWLLRSAQYELRWSPASAELPGELQGVIARFEVDVLRERSTLRLPFSSAQVRLNDPGVKIEGEAGAAAWSAAGDALLVELPSAGRQRIEIGLALATAPKDGLVGAQLRIPAVASSRVLVPPLTPADTITIPSALGEEQPAVDAVWQAELGPADSLSVRWTRAATDPVAMVEAEQLLLWRLKPSSVVVEGKWQFRPLTGKLREVVLRADPRFRLLPIGNGSSVVRQWSEEGETNLHHFVLDRAYSSDVTLTASFLLAGSTGIGNLNPPRLEPVADRTTRDWQAAWLAAGLQWNGQPGTLPASDFLQAWGDQTLTPLQAFRQVADAPRPTLAVTAVQNRLKAEEHIEWSLAPDHTSVRFRVEGTLGSANVHQLRFQLPQQFTIRSVAVTQNDAPLVSRWFRHADGMLTVLIDDMQAVPWQIEIATDRPHAVGKAATLPVLQSADLDLLHFTCVLRRRPGAAVALGKLTGWTNRSLEEQDAEAPAAGRVIARLDWTGTRPATYPPAVPVTIGAVLPGSEGKLLTRVLPDDEDWQLEVIANLNSPGGVFDELQFSVPRDWQGPFELEPPGRCHVESLPGQSRNLLRVQLAQPVRDQLALRIIAPLPAEAELIRLPVIDLIGSHELQRWVALPRRGSDSPLQWQTAGLQLRTELPEELRVAFNGERRDAEQNEILYEAIIDRYRATARPERTRREQPQIVLADHHVAWQTDRRIVGQSELTILPNGARTLVVQPPEAHELVAVLVNDVLAQLHRQPGISGAATIDLHSDSWPQWVQVIYTGRLPVQGESAGRWQFAAPTIKDVPVAHTRWQVTGPAPLQLLPTGAATASTAVDGSLAPFEALVKVDEGAADVPTTNHAESAAIWRGLWRQHWDRELAIIARRAPSSPLAPVIAARLQTLANKVGDQLTTPLPDSAPGTSSESLDTPSTSSQPADPLAATAVLFSQPMHELRHYQAGELSQWAVLHPGNPRSASTTWHWLLAAALMMGAVVLSQVPRSASLRDWVVAHPQLVLALLGMAALLIPGYLWLGILLLASALVAAFHSPWRQRG